MKKLYPLIICIFVILSCTSPKALEYRTYHNFTVQKLGFDRSTVSFDLEYFNPNNFGMQLKKTDLDIFIDGNFLGHTSSDSLIRIPKRDTFTFPVKFDLDMKNAFRNAMNSLLGKEVTIKLVGKIKAGKGNIFLSFPLNYETKQKFSFF